MHLHACVTNIGGMHAGGLVRGNITVDGHPKQQDTFAR
jgi:hypothetical protein